MSTNGKTMLNSFANKAWRLFTSLQLAIILILVLVGVTLIGTFVIQIPSDYAVNADDYLWWLENVAQTQTGAWYPFLRLMGFFDVFHSIWFILGGTLLVINIIICSLNRLKGIKTKISLNGLISEPYYYLSVKVPPIPSELSGVKSARYVLDWLRKSRYHIRLVNNDQGAFLEALKNRFSPLATYLIHLSLIIFILGFVIGHYFGFQNSSFIVSEGETKAVDNVSGLSLRLESFQAEYWADGSPKDYRSQVTILKDQRAVKSGLIQVNHPVEYHGVRFYQSFFGPAETIRVSQNGQVIFEGPVALNNIMDNHPFLRPAGMQNLSAQGYIIYLVAAATNLSDSSLTANQLGIEVYKDNTGRALIAAVLERGKPLTSGDLEILYSASGRFSGFLVNSDPGLVLIWTAAGFLLFGLIIVFYFPQRRIRVWIESTTSGKSNIHIKSDRMFSTDTEKISAIFQKEGQTGS